MRIFGKIAILVLILSMAGEYCAHADGGSYSKETANTELLDVADCHCSHEDSCQHEACFCHCLCHVPATPLSPQDSDLLLLAQGEVYFPAGLAPRDLSLPQDRPPISC